MKYTFIPNIITVPYSICKDSPKFQLSKTGGSVICEIQCAWSDFFQLAKELLGWSIISSSTWTVYQPHSFPLMPNCFASEIQNIEGVGWLGTNTYKNGMPIPDYEKAVLTVHWQTPDWDPNAPFITHTIESSTEFITLEHENLRWKSDGTPLKPAEAPAKLIKRISESITYHRLLSIPSNLFSVIGKVNKLNTVEPVFKYQWAPETLLCCDPVIRNEISMTGDVTKSLTVKFLFQPEGWNKFPRSDRVIVSSEPKLFYDTVTNEKTPPEDMPIYEKADFHQIIPWPWPLP